MPHFLKAAQYEPKSPQEHLDGISFMLPLEGRNGYVFALAYLNKKNPDTGPLLNLLDDHAHRLANSFGKDANSQHRFEQFLGALNETIAQTVRDGKFYVPIQNFHAIVGIICEDRMFLSGTGELTALFLHRKPSQRYQVFNLFRGIQTEQALPTWEKTFAVVLDGDLTEGDAFCVSQKDLQRHIPQDDLNSILTALPPKSATEKIRQYFPANDGLLLLIVKAESAQSAVPESYAKPLSDVSIDSFVRGQDETTKLLEDQKPDVVGFLKNRIEQSTKKLTERSRLLTDLQKGEPRMKLLLKFARSGSISAWKTIRHSVRSIAFAIQGRVNKDQQPEIESSLEETPKRPKMSLKELIEKTRKTSRRTKQISGVLIALVLMLAVGLAFLSRTQAKSETNRTFQTQVVTIQDMMDRAGGAIIYKDENQARSLYQQATTLIAQLPKDTPQHVETINKLMHDIEISMNELRHVVTIPNPATVATLTNTDATSVSGIRLLSSQSKLFVIDEKQVLWQIDQTKKQATLFPATATPISPSSILDAEEEDGKFIILDKDQHVYSVDAKTGAASPVTLSNLSGNAVALLPYAHRLYVLTHTPDNTDSQIFKFGRAGDGYGNGSSWIASKTQTLPDATAITVDGAMYVLRSNGSVVRFQNGAEVGWQIGAIDPPLQNPSRMWTNADSKFLYVLDPATKRLAIYKKDTGGFTTQYTSETFTDVRDFLVDEKAKTIYLLSGATIYSISAAHLTP